MFTAGEKRVGEGSFFFLKAQKRHLRRRRRLRPEVASGDAGFNN